MFSIPYWVTVCQQDVQSLNSEVLQHCSFSSFLLSSSSILWTILQFVTYKKVHLEKEFNYNTNEKYTKISKEKGQNFTFLSCLTIFFDNQVTGWNISLINIFLTSGHLTSCFSKDFLIHIQRIFPGLILKSILHISEMTLNDISTLWNIKHWPFSVIKSKLLKSSHYLPEMCIADHWHW